MSEIELAASLQQANIVPLLTVGETDGLPYYTMPFVDGLSLRARLERNGALPVGEAISLLRDVVRALAYAHDHGVVHRDIKPRTSSSRVTPRSSPTSASRRHSPPRGWATRRVRARMVPRR